MELCRPLLIREIGKKHGSYQIFKDLLENTNQLKFLSSQVCRKLLPHLVKLCSVLIVLQRRLHFLPSFLFGYSLKKPDQEFGYISEWNKLFLDNSLIKTIIIATNSNIDGID